MVEKISSILTQRMVNENIISVNEYDYYHYKLLVYCEFIVGHSVLLLVALCFRFALRAIVFLFVFNLLRGYTNGYHCETNIGCVTLSVCVLLWIRLHESIFLEKWTIYQGGGDVINDFYNYHWFSKSPEYESKRKRVSFG
ncbi:MAG: accessory gene regulator B family protein [Clostridia bacterium]|nr:accessory gene regulator B family protein [Clostridia bacterium]